MANFIIRTIRDLSHRMRIKFNSVERVVFKRLYRTSDNNIIAIYEEHRSFFRVKEKEAVLCNVRTEKDSCSYIFRAKLVSNDLLDAFRNDTILTVLGYPFEGDIDIDGMSITNWLNLETNELVSFEDSDSYDILLWLALLLTQIKMELYTEYDDFRHSNDDKFIKRHMFAKVIHTTIGNILRHAINPSNRYSIEEKRKLCSLFYHGFEHIALIPYFDASSVVNDKTFVYSVLYMTEYNRDVRLVLTSISGPFINEAGIYDKIISKRILTLEKGKYIPNSTEDSYLLLNAWWFIMTEIIDNKKDVDVYVR